MTDSTHLSDEPVIIPRSATGKRILYTILFVLIVRLVDAFISVLVIFQLAFSLVTRHPPGDRVVRFSDRVVRYAFQIGQYLTYNRKQPPFPFDDLPAAGQREDTGVGSPVVA